MKKILLFAVSVFAAATVGTVSAQDDISKQLEVTRAYTPRVGQAVKLPVEPNMTDTVKLRPEILYSITPTAWPTTFAVSRFAPAGISTAAFDPPRPLYVRAGLGYPMQTTLDLYFTPRMRTGSTFGVFASNRGSYSKIGNDVSGPRTAVEMRNGGGIFGSKQWRRYMLTGDLMYENRHYQPYGVADVEIFTASSVPMNITEKVSFGRWAHPFSLGRVSGSIGFGDTFTDLSHFNFRVGLDAGYAHNKSRDGEQSDIDLHFAMAQMLGDGRHGFEMEVSERGAIDPHKDVMADGVQTPQGNALAVTFEPRYVMALNKFRMRAGFDLRYVDNSAYDQRHVSLAPVFEASLNIAAGRFVPFMGITSQLLDGSYEALSHRNPFLTPGYSGPTGQSQDLRIGFSGDVGDIFNYKVSGGVSFLENYMMFIARQDVAVSSGDSGGGRPEGTRADGDADAYTATFAPVMFDLGGVDGARFTAGAELGLTNLGGFSARLAANWNKYSFNGLYLGYYPVSDLPRYDAMLELYYSHRDAFSITAGAKLIGDREYNNIYTIATMAQQESPTIERGSFVNSIGPVVDLSLGAEVKAARDLWIFLEGRNLAGQRLYPYNHYRGLGANVTVGIKAVF